MRATILPRDVFWVEERAIAWQFDIAKESFAIHVAIAFIELKPVVEHRSDEAVLGFGETGDEGFQGDKVLSEHGSVFQ